MMKGAFAIVLVAMLLGAAHGQIREDEEKLFDAIRRVGVPLVNLGQNGLLGGVLIAQIAALDHKISYATEPAQKADMQRLVQAAKKLATSSRTLTAEGERLVESCDQVLGVFLRTRNAPPGSDAAQTRVKARQTAERCVGQLDAWLRKAQEQGKLVSATIHKNAPMLE